MLVPSLHCTVCYLLTSFFCVCSWSTVPVGSCTHDIKSFLGVKKPLCKRTNCCLLSESTLEKTLARNLLREQEKSRSSWRNIRAVVECMGWIYISGNLGFSVELQYIPPWRLLCLSPTVGMFFLSHFLKRNNPAASFTQWIHLASKEVGRQSFTSCICSGKDIWLSVHPHSTWPSASLFVDLAIDVVMFQIVGTMTHSFLSRGGKRKTKPSKLADLVLDVQVLSCPFPGNRYIFHARALIQFSVNKWPDNKMSW